MRIFIDHNSGSGVADKAADGISKPYMDNVADFVARAARHHVYVIPALLHLPDAPHYTGLLPAATPTIAGGNVLYLTPGGHQAKARAAADFVSALKARDPALLPAILAYELDNETHLIAAAAPFSLRSGIIRAADGKDYDAASQDQLQQLADDQIIAFANTCVDAIRGVDPEALVSTNVFTFAAVGRSGPGRLHEDKSTDRRFPARPLALARSKLSHLDIHFYPFKPDTLDRDLRSIEWEVLSKACKGRGLPLLMGEYGAFRRNYPTIDAATEAMRAHLVRIRELGFAGDLYWTYDTDEQDYLWNARSEGGRIMEMLAR